MEILIIVLLTLLNGFFSLSEIALVSVKKSRIEHLAAQGNSRAKTVLKLLNNPENFLSSVQVGITLVGIISGAYGGATLTDDFENVLSRMGMTGEYLHLIALITVIGSITYFTIVIGELVPKTIAMNNPEGIALVCVPVINYFTYAAFPFVKLLSISTKLILKVIGSKVNDNDHISEEELKFLLKSAGKSGILETEESEVHQNLFYFTDQTAKSLMTHYSELEWVDVNADKQVILEQIIRFNHSKLIVCDGLKDNVVGYIHVKDLLDKYRESNIDIKELVQEPIYITQNTPSFKVLSIFRQKKKYLGFVIDEYGSLAGIVTLHDLIEAIVGDLPDDEEDDIEKIFQRSENTYLIDGRTSLYEFNKYFDKEIIEINSSQYNTIAGFMLDQIRTLPKVGDVVEYENYSFEIIDLDGRRIDKILVKFPMDDEDLDN